MAAKSIRFPRYVVKQHNRFWARFGVPEDVRPAFNDKPEYWVNLHTDQLHIAAAKVHRIASEFRARVAEARGMAGAVEADALDWRKAVNDADPEHRDVAIEQAIKAAANLYVPGGIKEVEKTARLFHDDDNAAALVDIGGPKARAFVDIVLEGKKPLRPFIGPWSSVRATEVEPKTASIDKAAVSRFVDKHPIASDVTKPAVAAWIEARKAEVSAATVQREVSSLRSFWSYLQTRGEVSEDSTPFAGQRFKDRRKDRAAAKREAFSLAEVSALYSRALDAKDQELADLIALAAYTGARREELATLKVADVANDWISIRGAKTDAGDRDVPVHSAVAPILARLIGKRKTGHVFEHFDEDKWGHRGDAVGKRFTRLKVAAGHGPGKTLHSIRHTFSQALRAQDVSEDLVADLMGHRLTTMTYGRYGSRAAARKLLPAALGKLTYPKPL